MEEGRQAKVRLELIGCLERIGMWRLEEEIMEDLEMNWQEPWRMKTAKILKDQLTP